MLKKVSLILLVFLLILSMVACNSKSSSSSPGKDGKVKISYLTHWAAPQVEELKSAIKEYNKIEPNVEIEVRAVPFGNLLTTLTTQSTGSGAPTITSIYELWLPQLVKDKIAAPAPAEYESDIKANYPEGLINAITDGGKVYGFPNEVNLYALNYNEKLFQEAGISAPPKTWAELVEDAKKLTKRDSSGKITQQGFGIITSWNSGVVHPWLSLLYSNGGELLDANHQPLLNSKQAQETTDLYKQLIFDEKTTDPSLAIANASTTGPYLDNFANGKTAMIIMANWWQSALKDSMGDKFSAIKTAPIPVGPSGSGSHSVSYSWLTSVNAKADKAQQEAAWKFLKWLNSNESGKNGSSAMGDMLMGMGIVPSRNSDIEAHKDTLATPFLKPYVDELKNAKSFPIVLGGNELTTTLQQQLEQMEFGKASSKETLENAQKSLTDLMSQFYSK
ncbi:ABC transporter substrate-binding protein [Neobacillus drentensis]|uniref:ABC transporter substrate-binding protein n=1 Tax=Neobacillus drentensis TaxID=220684 RepID=UPI00285E0309|nr:ABC transporter substrate-binding protein [Neobacillus drentensis]MDR7238859.1 multiple sugar transport system substrate-binding protein [Neobacillus drentensis]